MYVIPMNKRKSEYYNKLYNILLPLVFLLGLGTGILFKSIFPSQQDSQFAQTRENGYEYINPLIDFETLQPTTIKKYLELEDEVSQYISEKEKDREVFHISFYYKDLNSGAWIGIDENEKFIPASLNKVPLMIALYKKEMKSPGFLQTKLKYIYSNENDILTQAIKPEFYLESGKEYSIEELIDQLIIYSDNSVLEILYSTISNKESQDIFYELGISNPYEFGGLQNSMSVKEYSSFFRIMYNASYLNKELSSKALGLLTNTKFDSGIKAGVPDTIKVANKFGERNFADENEEDSSQIHDCGIVYFLPKPYLLCIMTKGSNPTKQIEVIKAISTIVYNGVSK